MFATILHIPFRAERLDEAIPIWRTLADQSLRHESGWNSEFLLTDRANNRVVVIGLWETEADARAYVTSGRLQQQFGEFLKYGDTQHITREFYSVSAYM